MIFFHTEKILLNYCREKLLRGYPTWLIPIEVLCCLERRTCKVQILVATFENALKAHKSFKLLYFVTLTLHGCDENETCQANQQEY